VLGGERRISNGSAVIGREHVDDAGWETGFLEDLVQDVC